MNKSKKFDWNSANSGFVDLNGSKVLTQNLSRESYLLLPMTLDAKLWWSPVGYKFKSADHFSIATLFQVETFNWLRKTSAPCSISPNLKTPKRLKAANLIRCRWLIS